MMRLLLGFGAMLGAFTGWAMDRDAAFITPAWIVGRAGWALMALCVAGLVVLPGCSTVRPIVDAVRDGDAR